MRNEVGPNIERASRGCVSDQTLMCRAVPRPIAPPNSEGLLGNRCSRQQAISHVSCTTWSPSLRTGVRCWPVSARIVSTSANRTDRTLEINPSMLKRVPDAPRKWTWASAFVSDPFEKDQRHERLRQLPLQSTFQIVPFGGALCEGLDPRLWSCLLLARCRHPEGVGQCLLLGDAGTCRWVGLMSQVDPLRTSLFMEN